MRLGSYPHCAVSVGAFSNFFFWGRSERFSAATAFFGQRNVPLWIPPLVRLGEKMSKDVWLCYSLRRYLKI